MAETATPTVPTGSLTRGYFRDHARAVMVSINNGALATAVPKEFSTGSLGWHAGGKVTIMVGGIPTVVQVGINLTVVGSKSIH